jgi:hypothetical protein
MSGRVVFGQNPVIHKAQGAGIDIDPSSPAPGWADILGLIKPDPLGANAPTLGTYEGNVRGYHYTATDKIDMWFHIPHDYAPGTDLYFHLHWSHNGTDISGSFIIDYAVNYAKGHNQANFTTPVTPQQTISTPDIATVPQRRHRIDEFQLSASSPSATQIDTDNIEPDGIIMANLTVNTIPTITGGTTEPFIHTLDIHYQTTGIKGTKQRAPDFWT